MKHKKLFAILTLVCFMFTLVPVAAFAEETTETVVEVSTAEQFAVATTMSAVTIKLTGSFELSETVTVGADQTVVLDLNGQVIAGKDTKVSGNYEVIANKGDLTVKDSVGGGAITLTATTDRDWSNYSAVIANLGGTLTIEGGTLQHLGGTDMAYAIDNNSTLGDTNLVINGGEVLSNNYRAIRQFANSTTNENNVTVNAGTVKGGSAALGNNAWSTAIWMQNPNTDANAASLTIKADAKVGSVNVNTGDVSNFSLSVADAALILDDPNGVASVLDNVSDESKAIAKDENGAWVIKVKVSAESVTLDKTATVAIGETVTLTATVTPADTTDTVTWTSSDETVATVVDGVVTAVKAGTATITATVGAVSASCEVTVTLLTQTVTATGYEGEYDGAAHSITVTAPEGATVTYSENGTDYSATNPSYTEVGTYTVYYKVEKANYTTVTGSATVEIKKATLIATYVSEAIKVDGTPALKVTVTGFVNGETAATAAGYVAPTVVNTNTVAGTYKLIPAGGEAANYEFKYVSGTLTIEKNEEVLVAEKTEDNTVVISGTFTGADGSNEGFVNENTGTEEDSDTAVEGTVTNTEVKVEVPAVTTSESEQAAAKAAITESVVSSMAKEEASLVLEATAVRTGEADSSEEKVTFATVALSPQAMNTVSSAVKATEEATVAEIAITEANVEEIKDADGKDVTAVAAVSVDVTVNGENALPESNELDNGAITITIPYADGVVPHVYYVTNEGVIVSKMQHVEWDREMKVVAVTTYHLSTYAIFVDEQVTSAYTVTFKDGDKVVGTNTVAKDSPILTWPTINKDSYNFKGWKLNDTVYTVDSSYEVTNDVTFTATWEKIVDTTPSTSGGGFSGSYNYPVNDPEVSNGKATLSESNAIKGETVVVTATPDNGYGVYEVIVTDKDGNVIPTTDNNNGTYSFVMPEGEVGVQVVCKPAITLVINDLYINVFGKTIKNDVAPIIAEGNRTMLPIRAIAEALGADVDWDPETQKVTITTEDTVIEIFIGKTVAYINGEAVQLDTAAFIDNNRTYLQVRFVSEALNADVNWNAETRTVTIIPE